jgi:hypothetical protein
MNKYWEGYKAGMLEEIRQSDDPAQRARELRDSARKEALAAHSRRYAWELLTVWWDIFEGVFDDHDDSDKP